MKTLLLILIGSSFFLFPSNPETPIKKETVKQTEKRLSKIFSTIPAGTIEIDGKSKTLRTYKLGTRVVTNFDYKEFLAYLKQHNRIDEYHTYYPDSTKWGDYFTKGSHYMLNIYKEYPVVNITYEAAQAYAIWLTERNREISENQNITFRLPTKEEWIYAANGGKEGSHYAWQGNFLRNSQGQFLANFVRVPDENIIRGEDGKPILSSETQYEKGGSMDIIAPAVSYFPSVWGLYNMNGNVAEMLNEGNEVIGGSWMDFGGDIQNRSVKTYDKQAYPNVGFRLVMIEEE
ncbi:MAG: formylglycine-generating enzyme family protein [Brumimicrobium sp.]|nr:formylglycine-generating enzyme family protein [Brumimicrobium sp.]